jgi:hypothetical protein
MEWNGMSRSRHCVGAIVKFLFSSKLLRGFFFLSFCSSVIRVGVMEESKKSPILLSFFALEALSDKEFYHAMKENRVGKCFSFQALLPPHTSHQLYLARICLGAKKFHFHER